MGYTILPIPQDLVLNKDKVAITLYESEKPNFNHTNWSSAFASNQDIINDLALLRNRCGDLIRRDTVKALAREASSLNWVEIQRFFLALMIWGFPYGQGGQPRTKNILNQSSTPCKMMLTICLIKDHEIENAYKTIDMTAFRSASFTKFLYFIGWAYGIKPLPLILDSNVAEYLKFIDSMECSSLLGTFTDAIVDSKGKITLGENAEKYMNYIFSIQSWAAQLKCEADTIECYMYLHRGNPGNVIGIGTPTAGLPAPKAKQMPGAPITGVSKSSRVTASIPISTSTIIGRLGLSDKNSGNKTWEISIPKGQLNKISNYPITHDVNNGIDQPEGIKCTLTDKNNPSNKTDAAFHGYTDHICIGSARRLFNNDQYTVQYHTFLTTVFSIIIGTPTKSRKVQMDFGSNNIVIW